MIKVYGINCAPLCTQAALQRALPLLDQDRQARVKRLQTPQKQAQRAAAGLLLRHLFGADVTVAFAENGKPYLADRPCTHFSLSHTGNWVFCAVAGSPVGIDAQEATPYNHKLVARWFTAEERQWMQADPNQRFTRLWTQKEAYAKLTGDGIVKTVTAGTHVPHVTREYRDFAADGLYVTVCTAGDDHFADTIEIVKVPLW